MIKRGFYCFHSINNYSWFVFFIFLFMGLVYSFTISGEFYVRTPNFCGDNNVFGQEECDGLNLSNKNCLILGYESGILKCTDKCTLDESFCGLGDLDEYDILRQCNDKIDNDLDGFIDFPFDLGCTNYFDNSEEEDTCKPKWNCENWTDCINGTKKQRCFDIEICTKDYLIIKYENCSNNENEQESLNNLNQDNLNKINLNEYITKNVRLIFILAIFLSVIVIFLIVYFLIFKSKKIINKNQFNKLTNKKKSKIKMLK